MQKSKHILVTGGAGFIGSHTTDALIARGDSVRVFDNLNPQVHSSRPAKPAWVHPEAEFVLGDVRDRDSLKKAIQGIDIIIHDAAEVGVGQSMYSIDQYISTNVQGTGILWDILVNEKHKVEKVLVASSMSNYGEGMFHCFEHGIISTRVRSEEQMKKGRWEVLCPHCETDLTPLATNEGKKMDCTSVYAQSKKDQEVYSLMIGKAYGIPIVAARYFNCYGPRQSLNNPYTGAAAIFSSCIKNNKAPLIYEDGKQKRDFIHVRDLVRGKLILLDHPNARYQVFNIGTGRPTSIIKLANTLAMLYGKNISPDVIHKFRNGDIRHCYADISKIRALGFEPQINLEEGLKDLAIWSGEQISTSEINHAHKRLIEKGLVV